MYSPRHFEVEELVPPTLFEQRGQQCLVLIDERVLMTLDALRDAFGPCNVNNWQWGGKLCQRGLRTPDAQEYSPTSQHSFGRAMDCSFKNHPAAEVRRAVVKNRLMFPFITFIETEVDWFHFDVRNGERITLWSPKTGISKVV